MRITRRIVATVSMWLTASVANAADTPAGETLALPLNAVEIQDFVGRHPELTLPGFLAALPRTLQANMVFVATSHSTQQATPALPRQIMYGADARFLLAISAVPGDPHGDEAEFAEFDPATGQYHYGTLTFAAGNPPQLTVDVPACNACHGARPRPIWGQYPDWPGVYGDETGGIAAAARADFAGFVATAAANPRYEHLVFSAAADGSTFELADRFYKIPNTNLNHELGNTVAIGAVTRMRAGAGYARDRWAVLGTSAAMDCFDSSAWDRISAAVQTRCRAAFGAPADQALSPYACASRLAGVDPDADLTLERPAPEAQGGSGGAWQTGAFQLQEAIAFQLLDELRQSDPVLGRLYAPVADTCAYISQHMALTGDARAAALTQSYSWFPFFEVFDAVGQNQSSLNEACSHIADQL